EMFFGYSVGSHGRIVVTCLDAPRYIGRDTLLELTLDNGAKICCTPDHLFMARDGRMVEAASLRANTSLMPLYRDLFRGYEMVYQPLTGYYYPTHRLADEWNLQHGIYEDMPNSHRHHIDFNRQNNMPWNLMRMDSSEHIRYHNSHSYGVDFDPDEHSAAIRDAFKRLSQDTVWYEHFRQVQQERAIRFWHDERYTEVRARVLQERYDYWQTAQARERQAERQKRFWENNHEARVRQGQTSKATWATSSEVRRRKQQEIARQINLREDIDANTIRAALDTTGSIRGAARLLECDRSVFRRFPEIVQAYKGRNPARRNHKVTSVRNLKGDSDVYCLTVPEAGNFALEAGVFVHNCGIVANVTPLEPGWQGHVTLELSNTTPLPAKVYAGEGIVQLLFFEGERPEQTYADRQGKYQGQRGVTLPKL
ncbi:MAG: dCTP deaminase, partial [Deinococcota bacterium]|nr:dCTP deaminase [Deinococcota bacterium]